MNADRSNASVALPLPVTERRGWDNALATLVDYWILTKPEVNVLVLAAALAGFYMGSRGSLNWSLLLKTLLGTGLVASGTGTLNQFLERRADARMRRTARRPLPAGRLAPREALTFGILLAAGGGLYLWLAINRLASGLAILTLASYLLLYTPLKKKTPLCTLVGAFPGAVPPLIGWAAARGSLSREAWALYAIVFLWQFPHFLAIAWMYREDYARAGLVMLPAGDHQGRALTWQILASLFALLPASLVPALMGQTGLTYLWGALALGLAFFYAGACLASRRSNAVAKRLLFASILYLPLVLGLMVLDKTST